MSDTTTVILKVAGCPGCAEGECPLHLGTPSHLGDHQRQPLPTTATTWTPEQMCQRATALVESGCYCGEEQCYACITANMLRQGASDRKRVAALEAEVARLKGELDECEGYREGLVEDFAWFQAQANLAARLEAQLATLTAEHARLKALLRKVHVDAEACEHKHDHCEFFALTLSELEAPYDHP